MEMQQTTNYKLEAGLNASLELQASRDHGKNKNTSRQASRQASRASRLWKLEQNNMTKKRTFFGPQNIRKSRRAKMDLPSKGSCEFLFVARVGLCC